jgi:hypothetical protein|tara:strand:- start:260 stop:499 length:240 start_codon:yes stop_codon:yes gene_type:complete
MLITLRICWRIFIDYTVWRSDHNSSRISRLRQERYSTRLVKEEQEERLVIERKTLTGLKNWIILYRLLSRKVVSNMVMW